MNTADSHIEDIDHEFQAEREWAMARPVEHYPAAQYQTILKEALRAYSPPKNRFSRLMERAEAFIGNSGTTYQL